MNWVLLGLVGVGAYLLFSSPRRTRRTVSSGSRRTALGSREFYEAAFRKNPRRKPRKRGR